MHKFSWKRKRGVGITSSLSSVFTGATNDEDDADEVDWLSSSKKSKAIALEDAVTKADRLKKEGVILAEGNKWWSAIRQWSAALSLTPGDYMLHEMMAQAYMQVGELVPGIRSSEEAVRAAPLWWCGHQTLGRALLGVGELKAALLCFSRALRLKPDNTELREEDLKWAFELLKTYQKLEKKKHEISTVIVEGENITEDYPPVQIVDLKINPAGFDPPDAVQGPSIIEPIASSSKLFSGKSLRSCKPRSSVSDSVRFVSCCSKGKSAGGGKRVGVAPRNAEAEESEKSISVNLNNMVCMRPSLPNR